MDTFISMEDYYLAEILRLEDHPEEAHSKWLLRESRVTIGESEEWARNRFILFMNAIEETCFLPNMQLGYANSCINISLKFREGPNHLAECKMNKDFEKFGSEVYTPTLSFNGGRQFYNQNISLVLQEKYTYRVRGREHLLVPGLLIAAQDESIDDVESGKSWFRALVIESPENEEMIDQSSYFFRRFSKRNLRKFKKRRKFSEPVANHTFDGDDIETEMLNHKEHQVWVFFVDFGYTKRLFHSSIRFLHKSFLEYPAFCLPVNLVDDRTKRDPEKFHKMCHWQTCYAYQCMVEKLSGDRVVDLTVKVLDLNALMENKTPNVDLYKQNNFKALSEEDRKKTNGCLEIGRSKPFSSLWFSRRLSKYRDPDGVCKKEQVAEISPDIDLV